MNNPFYLFQYINLPTCMYKKKMNLFTTYNENMATQ